MDVDKLPMFYEEIASGTFEDKTDFRVGLAVTRTGIYILTQYPHPDNSERKATYLVTMEELLQSIMDCIVPLAGKRPEKE